MMWSPHLSLAEHRGEPGQAPPRLIRECCNRRNSTRNSEQRGTSLPGAGVSRYAPSNFLPNLGKLPAKSLPGKQSIGTEREGSRAVAVYPGGSWTSLVWNNLSTWRTWRRRGPVRRSRVSSTLIYIWYIMHLAAVQHFVIITSLSTLQWFRSNWNIISSELRENKLL